MTSKVLLAWELGSGLGHLIPNLPILELLRARNFEACVCSPSCTSRLRGFEHLQAPALSLAAHPVSVQRTYTDILWNQGWSTEADLRRLVQQWQDILREQRIELVICDHSPAACFAAKTLRIPALITGTGFCCPPPGFPNFRDRMSVADSAEREANMLASANHILEESLHRSDSCLWSAIFSEASPAMTTFEELDHYPGRSSAEYWGAWSNSRGREATWTECSAKWRAFAYLKPHPHLFELFSVLLHYDVKLLAYCPGLDAETKQRLSMRGRVQFVDGVVDVHKTARDSDFTVLNAGHGTTVTSLKAGKPILQVPIYMEQAITARNTEGIQAGLSLPIYVPLKYNEVIAQFFKRLPEFIAGAERFAGRYRDYDGPSKIAQIVELIATRLETCQSQPQRSSKAPRAIVAVSPTKGVLESILCELASVPGVVIDRIADTAPWECTEEQQRGLLEQATRVCRRHPDAKAVVDARTSYLRYAECLLGNLNDALVVCIRPSVDVVIQEWLLQIGKHSGCSPVNHWSLSRTGFENHPEDVCYPKYDTTNLVDALQRYSASYRDQVDELTSRFPGRVICVGSPEEAVHCIRAAVA